MPGFEDKTDEVSKTLISFSEYQAVDKVGEILKVTKSCVRHTTFTG
jgi:hypothetical protein